jgi:hypothetical protein
MPILEFCLNDDVCAGLHCFERRLFSGDRQTSTAEMSEVLGFMPEASLDERFQSGIVPVKAFYFAVCGAKVQRCRMPACEVLREIGRR